MPRASEHPRVLEIRSELIAFTLPWATKEQLRDELARRPSG